MTEQLLLRDARRLRCRRYVVSRGAQPDPAIQHANTSPAPTPAPHRTRVRYALPSYAEWLSKASSNRSSASINAEGVPSTKTHAETQCDGASTQAPPAIAKNHPPIVGCAPSCRRTTPRPMSRGADSLFPSIANPLSGQLSSMPHATFDMQQDPRIS